MSDLSFEELMALVRALPPSANINLDITFHYGIEAVPGEADGGWNPGPEPNPIDDGGDDKVWFIVDASDKASKMAKVRATPSMATGEVNKVRNGEAVTAVVINGNTVQAGDFTKIEDGYGTNGLGGWVLTKRLKPKQ